MGAGVLILSRAQFKVAGSRMASSSSSIDEALQSEERPTDRIEEDDHEVGVSYSLSSCGCLFGFRSRLSRSSRGRYLLLQPQAQQRNDEVKQSWMMKKVKRFKDIIKAMAGRKWRSFINGIMNKRPSMRFQYDPRSYALNFDDGIGDEGGGGRRHDFRASSAPPVGLGIGMNGNEL